MKCVHIKSPKNSDKVVHFYSLPVFREALRMKSIAFSAGNSRWERSRKRLIFTISQIKDYMVSLVSDSFNYFSLLCSLDSLIRVSLQLKTWSEKPSRMTAFAEADNVAQKCRLFSGM